MVHPRKVPYGTTTGGLSWQRGEGGSCLSSFVMSWLTLHQPLHSSGPVSSSTMFLESLPALPTGLNHGPDFPITEQSQVLVGLQNLWSSPGLGPGICQPQPFLSLAKTWTSPWPRVLFWFPIHSHKVGSENLPDHTLHVRGIAHFTKPSLISFGPLHDPEKKQGSLLYPFDGWGS